MDLELTPAQMKEFQDAFLSAFPRRGDLERLVFFSFGVSLEHITSVGPFQDCVFELIQWAKSQGKLRDLLEAAHKEVPGNRRLAAIYKSVTQNPPTPSAEAAQPANREENPRGEKLPPPALTATLRRTLVEAVLLLPTSESFEGRSAFLLGLPVSLNRVQTNAQADLNMVFSQLDRLGKLDSGEWPLLLVIDNILEYAEGYQLQDVIKDVKSKINQAYTLRK